MVREAGLRRSIWARVALATLVVAGGCSSGGGEGPAADRPPDPTATGSQPRRASLELSVFPGPEWERADAEAMGFDPEALEEIAATAEELRSSCLLVVRRGRIVGEWHWDGSAPGEVREVFSVTKSVTSTLVGIAADDGDLAIGDPASTYIEEWRGGPSEDVTVRNLLSNDSGREWSFGLDYRQMPQAEDRTQFAIDLGQEFPPGEAWSYNNAAIQTLDRVLSVATGEEADAFAEARLFGPIGMADSELTRDASGRSTNAFFGMRTTCQDLARFGHLFLHDGDWDGRQIVSREWVEEATGAPSNRFNAAYGYLWWLNVEGVILGPTQAVAPSADPPAPQIGQIAPGASEEIFTAQGLGGQIVLVDPTTETVVVRLGEPGPDGPLSGFRAPEAAAVVTEALIDP